MNGAAAMVRCLEAEGITRIFGYPGVAIAPFYEEVFASGSIEHVLVRQEQAAGQRLCKDRQETGGLCHLVRSRRRQSDHSPGHGLCRQHPHGGYHGAGKQQSPGTGRVPGG